jgi:Domain of unknown function (DUF4194)
MASSSIDDLESSGERVESGIGLPVFRGDSGDLPLETRRVYVHLLLGPSLDAQRQSKLWPVLLRDERVLRARLHELFLELVIDHDQQVAFTRQVVDDEVDAPILLRRATLTFIQSALLLYLREQLTQADARGERAVLSRDEMIEQLGVFEADRNADRVKFARQAEGAVDRAVQLNLIRKLRGGEERYEVSPTLKLLFPAEEILELTHAYCRLSERAARGELTEDGWDPVAVEEEP